MTKFIKLFEPGNLGRLKVKNRIVQAPMCTRFATRDGSVTPRLLNYYRERAVGGTGLIIVEEAFIDEKESQSAYCQLGISDNSYIPGLSTLARVIKDNGARAGIQFCHAGSLGISRGGITVAPSRISLAGTGSDIPAELTIEEIKEIVKSFGNSARIAEQSGFDLVEIHGGHGYLIHQFISPLTNKRTDIYGGSLMDRIRLALEVFESVRSSVSNNCAVGMRISASEYAEGGITIEDSKVLTVELEKAGIDVIHVSAGSRMTMSETVPMNRPLACNAHLAEAIKKVIQIPVIASGAITSPQLAEEILQKGQGDFISLARPLLADPWFARKAHEGRDEDITPCIRCNDGCLSRGASISKAVSCTVNVFAGLEKDIEIQPAASARKIAVIGGGAAGMEAARVAAMRGHNVSIFDERDSLGGCLLEASIPEFKKDLRKLIDYQSTQVKKLGVKVFLREKVTIQTIREQGFDAVVLAAGSTHLIFDIPGINSKNVITAMDALRGKQIGKNVMVVGGGMVGCEVALYLAEQGKKVRIIELSNDIGRGIGIVEKKVMLKEFIKHNVQTSTGLRLTEIHDAGIVAVDGIGEKHKFEADSIILAMGFQPRNQLLEELVTENVEVYAVGDCIEPRRIYDAIHEAFLVGNKV